MKIYTYIESDEYMPCGFFWWMPVPDNAEVGAYAWLKAQFGVKLADKIWKSIVE